MKVYLVYGPSGGKDDCGGIEDELKIILSTKEKAELYIKEKSSNFYFIEWEVK